MSVLNIPGEYVVRRNTQNQSMYMHRHIAYVTTDIDSPEIRMTFAEAYEVKSQHGVGWKIIPYEAALLDAVLKLVE